MPCFAAPKQSKAKVALGRVSFICDKLHVALPFFILERRMLWSDQHDNGVKQTLCPVGVDLLGFRRAEIVLEPLSRRQKSKKRFSGAS